MAKRRYDGWKKQQPDHRDFLYRSVRPTGLPLPTSVDLRTSAMQRVPIEPNLDQGDLGSCGPNSVALHLAMNQVAAKARTVVLPSRLFIYYCTRSLMGTVQEDSGVDNRTMLKALAKYGWCPEKDVPYKISGFKKKPPTTAFTKAKSNIIRQYHAVPQTLRTMKECLADGRPFVFGFTVYESLESEEVARTGVVPMPLRDEAVLGGHDVLIVGYDDVRQCFIFKNSWGNLWGDQGDGTIPYAYATDPNLAGDFWTIVDKKALALPLTVSAAPFRITLEIDPTAHLVRQVS